jgi:hypothetical protein
MTLLFRLSVIFVLCCSASAQSIPFPGPGGPSGAVAIYSTAITTNSGGNTGNSMRSPTATSGSSGTKVSIVAGCNTGTCSTGHVGICVQSATYNCVATPVEVTFGGGHGFSLGTGAVLQSDFVALTFSASATLIVIMDSTSSNQGFNNGSCGTIYFQSTTSYNVQSPAGSWSTFTGCSFGFSQIQAIP